MTYGWAILIIAVILAALDFLGVFNTGTFIGPSCLATPGYLCSNPVMTVNTTGPNLLSFNFEQDTGQPIYEVSFACSASSNSSTGLPNANTANVFQFATSAMSSGSSLNISGMQCYGSNANLFQDNPIGTVFSGTLWIQYTTVPASTNYQYAKVARITAKVEAISSAPSSLGAPSAPGFSGPQTTPSNILYYAPIRISNPGGPAPSSVPSKIVSYIPITITNTANVPTSVPFQQMVNITESSFSAITYNNNFANFEFFTQSGTMIPAWIESNDSGKLITWVNLPTSIPASSSVTIYIGFASKTTNLLSSSGTTGIGEAPQLPCGTTPTSSCATYAEYDDGAKVFNNYWNFAGTSTAGFLSTATVSCGGSSVTATISVENSLTYNNLVTGSAGAQAAFYTLSTFSGPFMFDTLSKVIHLPNNGNDGSGMGFDPQEAICGLSGWWWTGTFNKSGTLNVAYNINSGPGIDEIPTPLNYFSVYSAGGSSTQTLMQFNYSNTAFTDNALPSSFYLYMAQVGPNGDQVTQWARTRAYPPNGVMPTVTFDFPQATGTGFQQMINITESSFSSYLTYNSNFANFEYFYANGTIIPSWIESNNSGKLVTWAKLSKSIPALSNATIYLGFASKTTNLLSSSGTTGIGEAPQLPCGTTPTSSCATYAEYDDGIKVFNNYWNFAGTTLPLTLSANDTSAGSYSVNNGITVSPISTGHGWMDIQSISTFNPQTQIIDGYGDIIYTQDQLGQAQFIGYGTTNPNGDAAMGNIGFGLFGDNSIRIGCWNLTTPVTFIILSNYVSGTKIISSAYETKTESFGSVNYNPFISDTGPPSNQNLFSSSTSLNAIISAILPSSVADIFDQWVRIRMLPPNGAMPTVTFGAVS